MNRRHLLPPSALAVILILLTIGLAVLILLPRAESEKGFSCRIKTVEKEVRCGEGRRVDIALRITNRGRSTWIQEGSQPVRLSYHLYDEARRLLSFENARTPLPFEVPPGQSLDIKAAVRAPLQAGGYWIEFDLVSEGRAWFRDVGSETAWVRLAVTKNSWSEPDTAPGNLTEFRSSMPLIENMRTLIRVTLEKNHTGFEGKTGPVAGFAGGSDYPQIWLRDSNTVIPASRIFYGRLELVSWLKEHLAAQQPDGALMDWIDSGGKSGRNTTASDQESSAVQAAAQAADVCGPGWLTETVDGIPVIARLERSLEFLLRTRSDPRSGLIIRAHTADWGDVDMIDDDEKAVMTDERTHWTVGIYDQSMFFQACLDLARMLDSLGQAGRAAAWRRTAETIRERTDQYLWQEMRGFYKIHIHLDELRHGFDEDDMFALGGNTQAVIAGLAGEEKAERIFRTALERQPAFGVTTVSGVLLPPYPARVFRHPLLDEPYEYQNGAQWDWFGGRLVYALFEHGFSQTGREKLLEMIKKIASNRAFYEWDSREGMGAGSDDYAGAAGVMGKALIEGYYGIDASRTSLVLNPRLGRDSGSIHIVWPAAGIRAGYDYRFSPDGDSIVFAWNGTLAVSKVRVLVPWSIGRGKEAEARLRLTVDGHPTGFELEFTKEDVYLAFRPRPSDRKAEVSLLPDGG